jgi:ArsR family transcriptional regulator, arsenate/arsenite/antimonite-responsive transcriptional repressor
MATLTSRAPSRRPGDDRYCRPPTERPLSNARARRLAEIGRALGDPIRVQIVDILRKHDEPLCVCEIVPLFDVSQPTISHHLKVLREAALVDVERHGIWSNYWVPHQALRELRAWTL